MIHLIISYLNNFLLSLNTILIILFKTRKNLQNFMNIIQWLFFLLSPYYTFITINFIIRLRYS